MKKLLIILMVVAMASFLFVGCLGTTPPIDPDEPVGPPSVTPVIELIVASGVPTKPIISLYSSATQYMNADEVADGILVMGCAPKYSEINVYVDDEVVGTSTAYGGDEIFIVFVAEDNLGADGAKTLYATATELGFAESANSTEYAFTLDTVAPEMVKVTAEGEGTDLAGQVIVVVEGTVTATFDEAVDEDAEDDTHWTVKDIGTINGQPNVLTARLISPKVVELEVDFPDSWVGNVIRVDCKTITDLAGNETTDFVGYCHLEELEE